MRAKIVFFLMAAMLVGLVVLVAIRDRSPHDASAVMLDGGSADALADGAPEAAAMDAGSVIVDAGAAEASSLGRPLRVTVLGWEVAAPGIVANGGRAPNPNSGFGMDVQLRAESSVAEVEKQLARGGGDVEGADVAVIPLPVFVASYERLRALEPEAFVVFGWSRGREGMFGGKDTTLLRPRTEETRVVNKGSDAAALLSLFALDASATAASRVRFVTEPKGAPFLAATRPFPSDLPPDGPNRLLLTTADASRLVPLVAIAPRGLLQSQPAALQSFARAWFGGMEKLRRDVSAAARQVAAEPGAPDPALLLEQLGQVELASVRDAARLLGVSGRAPLTLATLFQRMWTLSRDSGQITSPAPEAAPVATGIVAAIVRAEPIVDPALPALPLPDGGALPANTRVLLASRRTDAKLDEAQIVADAAMLAAVFDRATVRVSAKNPETAKSVVAAALERFDLPAARLIAGGGPTDVALTLEVLGQ